MTGGNGSEPITTPTQAELLELVRTPARLGGLASDHAARQFGGEVLICEAPALPTPAATSIIRRGDVIACDRWPRADLLEPGDRIVVSVGREERTPWLVYLTSLRRQAPRPFSIAPIAPESGATHALWLVASARITLADEDATLQPIHVEARHDLLGSGLAQIALTFGADVISGPRTPDRRLPLASVPRPTESSFEGLCALVEHAGHRPRQRPDGPFDSEEEDHARL